MLPRAANHQGIMTMRSALLTLAGLLVVAPAHAQTGADSTAIRQTALDYIDGWYTGDGDRMARALHPDLAKRIVQTDPASGESRLGHMGKDQLVQATTAGYGKRTPEAERRADVTILDIFENAATVRVDARDWVDYLHIARWDGRWMIINVLWAMRPRAG